MKILMRTLMAGPGGNRLPGLVYDVSPEEAARLVTGGYAVLVAGSPAPEAAVAALPETADRPRPGLRPAGRRK